MPDKNNNELLRGEEIKELVSREYRLLKEEEAKARVPQTFYEKACAFAEKILPIDPDKKSSAKIQAAIDFAHLRITPKGVASLMFLFIFLMSFPAMVLLVTNFIGLPGLDLGLFLFVILITMPIAYYLYIYPTHLKKLYEMNAGNDMVSAVLYMVVYMRNVPSLEGATDFAARNIPGALGDELKKLMFGVRVGNYLSINEALLDYANKWKENREFVEAIELLISSLKQPGEQRIAMLNEAVRVVLDDNFETARLYVQNLKMPIMVINAMGLILPVMGLVMFPIIAIFLKVDPIMLFIMYDIGLPLALFFIIIRTLEKRPATYSKIDISEHPKLPPPGKVLIGGRPFSPLPFAVIVMVAFILAGILTTLRELETAKATGKAFEGIIPGILLTLGLSLGPATYYKLLSSKRVKLREDVRSVEAEFKEALFQLGNTISLGTPIESALDEAIKRMEGLKIKSLFLQSSSNIKRFGMTFEQSFFDKTYGAVLYYPSRLIKSIMRAVTESAKKGVSTASLAMISISSYLRDLHRTQEQISEQLSDVVNSLRFQANLLSPLIGGVISTMAIIIIRILQELAVKTAAITPGAAGAPGFIVSSANLAIVPFQFIMVVGIYLIESFFLMSFLISGIQSGDDPIGKNAILSQILIIGSVIFVITTFASLLVFTPLISQVV